MRVVRYIVLIAILGVLSFGGGILLMDLAMGFIVGKGSISRVPEVTGLPLEEATRLLEDSRLFILVNREEFDAEADSGVVIKQRPEPGDKVKRGRRITVTLSKGPERSVVPEVSGQRVRQARIALAESELQVTDVIRVPHEQVEREVVIASSPVAGTPAVAGDRVRLLVSLGPEPSGYRMPELVGSPLADVRRHLRLFELSLSRVSYRTESETGTGVVLEQSPPPGWLVDRETGIELVVSSP